MKEIFIKTHLNNINHVLVRDRPVAFRLVDGGVMIQIEGKLDGDILIESGGPSDTWPPKPPVNNCTHPQVEPQLVCEKCGHRESLGDLLCDIAQILDGWHADGTAWSEWDESVRRRLSLARKSK